LRLHERVNSARSVVETNSPRASEALRTTLPMKPSQTTTSAFPFVDVAPLSVADEVETGLFQNAVGLLRQLVALSFFFTDREKADARLGDVEEHLA